MRKRNGYTKGKVGIQNNSVEELEEACKIYSDQVIVQLRRNYLLSVEVSLEASLLNAITKPRFRTENSRKEIKMADRMQKVARSQMSTLKVKCFR